MKRTIIIVVSFAILIAINLDNSWASGNNKEFNEILKNAKNGDALAMVKVGHAYEQGTGVEQNILKAIKWYKKTTTVDKDAAGSNKYDRYAAISVAKSELGRIYSFGIGVPQDFTKAKEYLYEKGSLSQTINIVENARKLHKKSPQLFGYPLVGVMRNSMRHALKNAEVATIQEDYGFWCDKYNPTQVFKGAQELSICYSLYSDKNVRFAGDSEDLFAYAIYTFPSKTDTEQVTIIRDMIIRKYGKPNHSNGIPSVGSVIYAWALDGVNITVSRDWPDTTTYLKYSVPNMEKAMDSEIAAMKKNKKEQEMKTQSNAF